jgi:ATP-dependent protease ClpP protease subunit
MNKWQMPRALERAREIAMGFRGGTASPALLAAKKNDKGEGELIIYAPIGQSFWEEGVTDKQVIEKLEELKGIRKLSVRINSEGGSVWDGKAIENAIRRFDCEEKVTYVDGLAASAATFIAMACPKVVSAPNATWMIHEAAWMAIGRASDLRSVADVLDKENRTIAETYARKCGKSVEECLDMMAKETWMNAEESMEHGFTDEIEHMDEGEGGHEKRPEKKKHEARARTPEELFAQACADADDLKRRFPAAGRGQQQPGEPGSNASTPGDRQEKTR